MNIGIPKEIKPQEGRVALLPEACEALVGLGCQVFLQQGAGTSVGQSDEHYQQRGVEIVKDAESLYGAAEIIVKVKEPFAEEINYLNKNHVLFSFLHLAADHALAERLRKSGMTAFGFETLQVDGALPILAPMSEIAGRISVQIGTTLLHQNQGGKGILLGGVAGTDPGNVLVIGAGSVGMAAANVALGLGANVTVLDVSQTRLDLLAKEWRGIDFRMSDKTLIDALIPFTDLLIGAVMVVGRHAPTVVSRAQVAAMQAGSVIADVAIDQGGCIETSLPVSWDNPYYRREGVLHFSVTNMPGAVPKTASQALSAQILPHLERYLAGDWESDEVLRSGLNLHRGEYANERYPF